MIARIARIFAAFVCLPTVAIAQNLLTNGGFDTGLDPWRELQGSGYASWSSLDANGSGASGSVLLRNNRLFGQGRCYDSITPGGVYEFGTKIRLVSGTSAGASLVWFGKNDCALAIGSVPLRSSTVGSWISLSTAATAPANAYGFIVFLSAPEGHFDDVYVIPRCIPPQVAPVVTGPASTAAGEPVTVSWATAEAADRFIVEVRHGSGARISSDTVDGATRAFTLSFATPGAYTVRVTAENACGRKESAAFTIDVTPAPPRVAVTSMPAGMLQVAGTPSSDTFTIGNFGGSLTVIDLDQAGAFFTHNPTAFALHPGQTQTITIAAVPQAEGTYEGALVVRGAGVPEGLTIAIRLRTAAPPSGTPVAESLQPRLDLAAPSAESPQATVSFRNSGSGAVRGLLTADVPWLVPLQGFVEIAPGAEATLSFRVDRAQRPIQEGSVFGNLTLVYLDAAASPPAGKRAVRIQADPPAGTKSTVVPITDTVRPEVTPTPIPPLAQNEMALFISGAVHAPDAAGMTRKSDVAIFNAGEAADLSDLRLLFAAANAPVQSFSIPSLASSQTLQFADVSKSVFAAEPEVATLQIRGRKESGLTVSAIIRQETQSGPVGTWMPVFASDRSVAAEQSLFLPGVRVHAPFRTDLYLQETSGNPATVRIEYLTAAGSVVGTTSGLTVDGFALRFLQNAPPPGTAAAIVTNTSTAGGKIQAWAAVSDLRTSDSWAIVDWSRYYGYAMTEPVIVPIAGKSTGRAGGDFRTDLVLMNAGPATGTATLTYFRDHGVTVQRSVTVAARSSQTLEDLISSSFNITTPAMGAILIEPQAGSRFAVAAQTYARMSTGGTLPGTVPVLAAGSALGRGEKQRIHSIDDAASAAVTGAKAGTSRANVALIETSGREARVRVTLHYTAVQGSASAVAFATADFDLVPNQFLMLNGLTTSILRERRFDFGDLRDVQVDFEVTEGDGRVLVVITSTDNKTNDPIIRAE